ncbi:unnamed protein product [Durusdinium trenchii]|uniref:Uncharacterized protein n=1 Tax=Durusdinium trenchii TaxID=1381693 RepID=A0ABP0SP05_9DINO
MFGVSGPHKRGALGPSTESRNEEEEFEPDSQASRDFEARRKMIKEGKRFEKSLLQNRSAVAQAMLAQGGRVSVEVAGKAVMDMTNGVLPGVVSFPQGCEQPDKKKKEKKDKKKKDKKKKEKKEKKKKDKKKSKKKKDKKKSSSSSSSSSSS